MRGKSSQTPIRRYRCCKNFTIRLHRCFCWNRSKARERWGRFSFLGIFGPFADKVFPDRVLVQGDRAEEEIPFSDSPLPVLRMLMSRFRPARMPELPRFRGLVGYLTYEAVSFFENIPSRLPDRRPLASFVIPDTVLIFDNVRHTLLVLAIMFLDDPGQAGRKFAEGQERIAAVLQQMAKPVPMVQASDGPEDLQLQPRIEEEDYRFRVRKIKEYILAGDVIQTVISQPFSCAAPQDLWSLYRAQRYVNPSPYLYFLHVDHAALIGSSPETMVRLENGVATVRPIAGTRPRGKTEQQDRSLADDLLSDEKERAEHLMLVDLGRNDLGRVAETGTVQVTDLMVVERYSHVMHLVSNVNCHLSPAKMPGIFWRLRFRPAR
ncbi:MAG: chorismate-binding protein [Balneolaceae bacterium]|nr:chorismate-binding protein [Balneolaceae bacterium]